MNTESGTRRSNVQASRGGGEGGGFWNIDLQDRKVYSTFCFFNFILRRFERN